MWIKDKVKNTITRIANVLTIFFKSPFTRKSSKLLSIYRKINQRQWQRNAFMNYFGVLFFIKLVCDFISQSDLLHLYQLLLTFTNPILEIKICTALRWIFRSEKSNYFLQVKNIPIGKIKPVFTKVNTIYLL